MDNKSPKNIEHYVHLLKIILKCISVLDICIVVYFSKSSVEQILFPNNLTLIEAEGWKGILLYIIGIPIGVYILFGIIWAAKVVCILEPFCFFIDSKFSKNENSKFFTEGANLCKHSAIYITAVFVILVLFGLITF